MPRERAGRAAADAAAREDTPPTPEEIFAGQVRRKKNELRVLRDAQALLATEGMSRPPEAVPGTEFMAQPDEEVRYRIGELWPAGGNVLLAAQ